jgi:hypothetical protein
MVRLLAAAAIGVVVAAASDNFDAGPALIVTAVESTLAVTPEILEGVAVMTYEPAVLSTRFVKLPTPLITETFVMPEENELCGEPLRSEIVTDPAFKAVSTLPMLSSTDTLTLEIVAPAVAGPGVVGVKTSWLAAPGVTVSEACAVLPEYEPVTVWCEPPASAAPAVQDAAVQTPPGAIENVVDDVTSPIELPLWSNAVAVYDREPPAAIVADAGEMMIEVKTALDTVIEFETALCADHERNRETTVYVYDPGATPESLHAVAVPARGELHASVVVVPLERCTDTLVSVMPLDCDGSDHAM